jgi:hypothetical protein
MLGGLDMLDERKIREMTKELFMIWHEIRMELDKEEIEKAISRQPDNNGTFFYADKWPWGNGMSAPALVCVCKDDSIKDPWEEFGGDQIIERIEKKKHLKLCYKDYTELEEERIFAAVFKRLVDTY